jgi:hypothetical protein
MCSIPSRPCPAVLRGTLTGRQWALIHVMVHGPSPFGARGPCRMSDSKRPRGRWRAGPFSILESGTCQHICFPDLPYSCQEKAQAVARQCTCMQPPDPECQAFFGPKAANCPMTLGTSIRHAACHAVQPLSSPLHLHLTHGAAIPLSGRAPARWTFAFKR